MVDGSGDGGLGLELGNLLRAGRFAFTQELESHRAIERCILRPVDHTHAAPPEFVQKLEVINRGGDDRRGAAHRAEDGAEWLLLRDVNLGAATRAGLHEGFFDVGHRIHSVEKSYWGCGLARKGMGFSLQHNSFPGARCEENLSYFQKISCSHFQLPRSHE